MKRPVIITKEYFELILSRYSFRELNKTEYLELAKNNELKYANEFCYFMKIYGDDFLLVLSSIDKDTHMSRPYAKDAIRVFPMEPDLSIKRIKWVSHTERTIGWERRLDEKTNFILGELGFDNLCSKCKSKLFLRRNKKNNSVFLSCSKFPDCRGSIRINKHA